MLVFVTSLDDCNSLKSFCFFKKVQALVSGLVAALTVEPSLDKANAVPIEKLPACGGGNRSQLAPPHRNF